MIVDASVVLGALLPDEREPRALEYLHEYSEGRLDLSAPHLLTFEVANVLWFRGRRGTLAPEDADEILQAFQRLGIPTYSVEATAMFELARRFDITAYDASYLALASNRNETLATADRGLFERVHRHLDWVQFLGPASK
jgi:predicted nucleic acid-binding protein